jgi:hypothetical protein
MKKRIDIYIPGAKRPADKGAAHLPVKSRRPVQATRQFQAPVPSIVSKGNSPQMGGTNVAAQLKSGQPSGVQHSIVRVTLRK